MISPAFNAKVQHSEYDEPGIFQLTGEVREPKKGEYFIFSGDPEVVLLCEADRYRETDEPLFHRKICIKVGE